MILVLIYGVATGRLQTFAKRKKVLLWMVQNVAQENGVLMVTVNPCPKGELQRMALGIIQGLVDGANGHHGVNVQGLAGLALNFVADNVTIQGQLMGVSLVLGTGKNLGFVA